MNQLKSEFYRKWLSRLLVIVALMVAMGTGMRGHSDLQPPRLIALQLNQKFFTETLNPAFSKRRKIQYTTDEYEFILCPKMKIKEANVRIVLDKAKVATADTGRVLDANLKYSEWAFSGRAPTSYESQPDHCGMIARALNNPTNGQKNGEVRFKDVEIAFSSDIEPETLNLRNTDLTIGPNAQSDPKAILFLLRAALSLATTRTKDAMLSEAVKASIVPFNFPIFNQTVTVDRIVDGKAGSQGVTLLAEAYIQDKTAQRNPQMSACSEPIASAQESQKVRSNPLLPTALLDQNDSGPVTLKLSEAFIQHAVKQLTMNGELCRIMVASLSNALFQLKNVPKGVKLAFSSSPTRTPEIEINRGAMGSEQMFRIPQMRVEMGIITDYHSYPPIPVSSALVDIGAFGKLYWDQNKLGFELARTPQAGDTFIAVNIKDESLLTDSQLRPDSQRISKFIQDFIVPGFYGRKVESKSGDGKFELLKTDFKIQSARVEDGYVAIDLDVESIDKLFPANDVATGVSRPPNNSGPGDAS